MRIVGGRWRSRQIYGPGCPAIRPTSDQLRETIFNILEHSYGDSITDARVLDLFAGTGGMGLEALSRGAAFCLFVDHSVAARALMRASIEALGCGGRTRVFKRDATKLGEGKGMEPFTLIFCDPPYRRNLAGLALSSALAGGWLAREAFVVVEEAAETPFDFPEGFAETERRIYGDTLVAFANLALN